MKKLLHFELFKLRNQKSLYICSAILLVALFLTMLMNKLMFDTFSGGIFEELLEMSKPTAVSSMLTAVSASDFTLIVGIFIALYVCGDFGQHTIKNIYSRGFSRTSVYFSKLIICVAYTIVMYFIALLFAFILGCAFFGYGEGSGRVVALIFGQLIACIAYSTVAFSISFMVRKNGVAIALTIVIPLVLTLILSLIDVAISSDTFALSDYWLDGILTNLSQSSASNKTIICGYLLPVVYGGLFVSAGFLANYYAEV